MAKKIPAINASSMADISFLLLIFFLVTTSMDVNQGLARRLPAPIPPDQKIEDTDINKRNLFVVKINWENTYPNDPPLVLDRGERYSAICQPEQLREASETLPVGESEQ